MSVCRFFLETILRMLYHGDEPEQGKSHTVSIILVDSPMLFLKNSIHLQALPPEHGCTAAHILAHPWYELHFLYKLRAIILYGVTSHDFILYFTGLTNLRSL